MVLGFGGLVALSVGGVLAMSVYANFTNTLALLNKQAVQLITSMQETIDRDAAEGERVVSGLARLYADGEFDIGNDNSMKPIITALLMSEPVVETIVVIKPDHQTFGLARTPDHKIMVLPGKGAGPPEGTRARPGPDQIPVHEANRRAAIRLLNSEEVQGRILPGRRRARPPPDKDRSRPPGHPWVKPKNRCGASRN